MDEFRGQQRQTGRGRSTWMGLALTAAIECALIAGCAAETPANPESNTVASGGEERPRRRRRRRRSPDVAVGTVSTSTDTNPSGAVANGANPSATGVVSAGAASAGDGSGSSIGTPTVSSANAARARTSVEWIVDGTGGEAQCGVNGPAHQTRCPQCPREPENAGIVRAFVAVEHDVIRCAPPTRPDGKLAVRVQFANDGTALSVRFPGVRMDAAMGECLGRAVCGARVPNFQNPIATVPYEIHVLVPER